MKTFKSISFSIVMLLVMASFSQCSSTKRVQDKSPIAIGEAYFQKWISGVEGGGSGINVFITASLEEQAIILDSIYFRGKSSQLENNVQNDKRVYIGRFTTNFNKKKDIVMSNEPNAEYGNTIPITPEKIPFDLKENECVVSYTDGETTKYFKIDNLDERESIPYPNAPVNKQ